MFRDRLSRDGCLPSDSILPLSRNTQRVASTVSPLEILLFALTLLVMVIGFGGALLPGLPGTPLIAVAALIHRWILSDRGAGNGVLLTLVLVAMVSAALDFAAAGYGAKRLGATWRGMTGAAIGGLLGLAWPPAGWILGPLLGAIVGEWMGGRPWTEARSAGLGAALGLVAGTAVKVAAAGAMIVVWTCHILWRAFNAA